MVEISAKQPASLASSTISASPSVPLAAPTVRNTAPVDKVSLSPFARELDPDRAAAFSKALSPEQQGHLLDMIGSGKVTAEEAAGFLGSLIKGARQVNARIMAHAGEDPLREHSRIIDAAMGSVDSEARRRFIDSGVKGEGAGINLRPTGEAAEALDGLAAKFKLILGPDTPENRQRFLRTGEERAGNAAVHAAGFNVTEGVISTLMEMVRKGEL
ncbi:MAG TPA: hypothetical protein VED40_17450 [Azospirillaceae bacterium]|nr:hypothetical protein [Azospirillaceae bacterium]